MTAKMGRPRMKDEDRRTQAYRFRVNDFEKKLLDETGTSTKWRSFMVQVSVLNKTIKSGLEFDGEKLTPESLKWTIGNLFFDVFHEGLFVDEDD